MSSTGTPPKGEPAPLDVSPSSHPVESGAVDQAWFDVEFDTHDEEPIDNSITDSPLAQTNSEGEHANASGAQAEKALERTSKSDGKPSILPRSLSPVVLANEGRVLSEPPVGPVTPVRTEPSQKRDDGDGVPQSGVPQRGAEERVEAVPASPVASASSAPIKLRLRWLGLAVAALGIAVAPPLLLVKRTAPRAAATPSARVPEAPALAASAAIDLPPLVTVAATNAPPPETSATQIASAAVTAPAPAASGATDDSFLTAFQRNAAKQDAKWANVKPPPERSNHAVAPAASIKSDAAKLPKPDPMDVLKRLEETRKAKR